VRVAIQALAAVLGGTQSLHTNSQDEALALPSKEAATIALRTQQIIAHESGVTNTIDPLGGSYFVEALTLKMERQVYDYFEKIKAVGGLLPAIQQGFFQREIAAAAYRYQRETDDQERFIVGVNQYDDPDERINIPILQMDPQGFERQMARLERTRRKRDNERVGTALNALREGAEGTDNLMPAILEAVRAYATLGEIIAVLRGVFGTYQEPTYI
jgi:methylmalonyl-CoA mutase N-terminal domain/subunit